MSVSPIRLLVVAGMVYRAWSRRSLTPLGLVVAGTSGIAQALHPWATPLTLLLVFYLGGTKATKVKHDIKARKTLSATGSQGGEGARNHLQVLANSVVATFLSIIHTVYFLRNPSAASCFSFGHHPADILMVGIVANYAAVAADTFSSELGILAKSKPRLITSLTLREVPPGTNGGVTAAGLGAGLLGAFSIALTSAIILPSCSNGPQIQARVIWTLAITLWGLLGSILDSVLGGLLQASVIDKRSGKIVEGSGGRKVLIHPGSTSRATNSGDGLVTQQSGAAGVHLRKTEAVANAATLHGSRATSGTSASTGSKEEEHAHESRRIESGRDWLDNNGVNVLMAFLMSVGAMGAAQQLWGVDVWDLWA
ncbi:Uncharacterized protein PECH_002135 [Penicillium ucsense]|uniref:DUF92 domain protein n=1 Tax=Penicillium ucsense TaxID=2839758 RepID=A0A8J8W3P7_9EURO|nr:Uncharacterized protein PECM_007177 [Penicillium ucsense]KAF7738089.1 Uncharacterized protein PECH_002135 [Penicillium ucsense]